MTTRPTVHLHRALDERSPCCDGRVLQLPRRAVIAEPLRGLVEVRCERGSLWVTLDGALADVVLEAGDAAVFDGRGRLVVEALADATVRLCPMMANAA